MEYTLRKIGSLEHGCMLILHQRVIVVIQNLVVELAGVFVNLYAVNMSFRNVMALQLFLCYFWYISALVNSI
jgi:hypothetical protein